MISDYLIILSVYRVEIYRNVKFIITVYVLSRADFLKSEI